MFFTIPNHANLLKKQQIEWNFRAETYMELSSAFKDCTNMPKLLILPLQQWEQKGLFHWLLARSVPRQPTGVNSQRDLLPAVLRAVPAYEWIVTAATGKQSGCVYQEQWGNTKSLPKTLRNVKHLKVAVQKHALWWHLPQLRTFHLAQLQNQKCCQSRAVQKGEKVFMHCIFDVICALTVHDQYNSTKDTSSLYVSWFHKNQYLKNTHYSKSVTWYITVCMG